MFIRNNSNKEWLHYHIGNEVYIDIKAKSVFEINDDVKAKKLLSLLGSPNQLVEVKKEAIKKEKEEVKKKKVKVKKIKKIKK